jgi:dihydroceramidase
LNLCAINGSNLVTYHGQILALVGIGSFAFHATLLYEAQLADELPMIFGASYGIFLLTDTGHGFGLRTARSRVLAVGISAGCFLFSLH